ncbi:rRNA large subunit pseudouridine synthase E [soil metagenome]
MLVAFHKPYGVLSQFTKEHLSHRTLAEFGFPKDVYPIGRLDADSEGLLLLSDEARWNQRLLHPSKGHPRTYHAQVEGVPTSEAMEKLRRGVKLPDFQALPCQAAILDPGPDYPARVPPIRERKTVPTTWIALTLIEGKNRQVRRVTATVGFPTLRLVRHSMGKLKLDGLKLNPGEWRELTAAEIELVVVGSL